MRPQVRKGLESVAVFAIAWPHLILSIFWLDNKDEAVNFYKRGIEEFLSGLSITIKGDSSERGLHIQDKMESNLNMALNRVEELSNL